MKTIVIIFSFTLISLFSVGSYFLYKLHLKYYKREFNAYIFENKKETVMTTITINPSELYTNSASVIWEDENKEIIYKGVLYDIVSIKSKGLTLELTAVSDKQEMVLKKQFANIFDTDSGRTTKAPFSLLKAFFALKYMMTDTNIEFIDFGINTGSFYASSSFQLINRPISQETPPPDLFI